MADSNTTEPTDPGAPTNDREYQVWEHGRCQGHREAMAAARRARETIRVERQPFVIPPFIIGDESDG